MDNVMHIYHGRGEDVRSFTMSLPNELLAPMYHIHRPVEFQQPATTDDDRKKFIDDTATFNRNLTAW